MLGLSVLLSVVVGVAHGSLPPYVTRVGEFPTPDSIEVVSWGLAAPSVLSSGGWMQTVLYDEYHLQAVGLTLATQPFGDVQVFMIEEGFAATDKGVVTTDKAGNITWVLKGFPVHHVAVIYPRDDSEAYLVAAAGERGFVVANSATREVVYSGNLGGNATRCWAVTLLNNYPMVFVPGAKGVDVFNMKDPAAPQQLGTLPIPDAQAFESTSENVFIADGKTLHVYGIKQREPTTLPFLVSTLDLPRNSTERVVLSMWDERVVRGELLFAAAGTDGTLVFDVKDARSPRLEGVLPPVQNGSARSVFNDFQNVLVFVAEGPVLAVYSSPGAPPPPTPKPKYNCPDFSGSGGVNCNQTSPCCGGWGMSPFCLAAGMQCCTHYVASRVCNVQAGESCCGALGPAATSEAFCCSRGTFCCSGGLDSYGTCCNDGAVCCQASSASSWCCPGGATCGTTAGRCL